jgi:hypothetical protein
MSYNQDMEIRLKATSDSIANALTDKIKGEKPKSHTYPSHSESSANLEQARLIAGKALNSFRKSFIIILADDKGNYSKTLPAGKYCVLIESANRKSYPMKKQSGSIYYRYIVLKPGGEEHVSNDFMPDEYFGD